MKKQIAVCGHFLTKWTGVQALKRWQKKRHPVVGIIRLSGVISDEGLLKKGLHLNQLEPIIEKAFHLPRLKAIALQINSPGGAAAQSELIYTRIRALAEEKKVPVYAFAEGAAASGGYWLACAGDEIYALRTSIVGSIGVISAGFGFVEAIQKIGIERRVYTEGKNKSILDPFKPEKEDDIKILHALQKDIHDAFKHIVCTRRKGKINEADEGQLFNGDVWMGEKAKALGLIDEVGELREVMRKKYGKKVKLVKVNKPKGFLQRKLETEVGHAVSGIGGILEERLHWQRYGL